MQSELLPPAGNQELTSYDLNDDLDQTNNGYKVGVYFNQKAYIITRFYSAIWCFGQKGDFIGCASFDIDTTNGHFTHFARRAWVVNPSLVGKDNGLSGNSVAAVVYNGRIYAFYDYINPANYSERLLYYKSTSDPTRSWEPDGGTRISVAPTLSPGFGVGTPSLAITAAVLNNKLHVFYTHNRVASICHVVFDDTNWSAEKTFETKGYFGFNDMDSKTVITDTGAEIIAIIGVGNYYNKNIGRMLLFNGSDFQWSDTTCPFSDKGLNGSYVRLAFGTVAPGSQRHVLQIFGETGSPPVGIYRCEYTLPGDSAKGGSFSAWSNVHDTGSTWCCGNWCPIPHYLADTDQNLQQYISLNYRGSVGKIVCATYSSDYYKFISENSLSTALDNTHADAWTIVGIIEGVPPFCLNNNEPGSASECSVKYGESSKESVSTSISYDASFTLKVSGGTKACSGGFSFSEGFKCVDEYSKETTKSIEYTWANNDSNGDGSKGFMLVQKPTLTVRNYTRYATDKSTSLGDINFTSVTSVDLVEMVYDLEAPPAGMKIRPKSSNYKNWYHCPPGDANIYEKINSLSAVAGVGSCTASIEVSVANKHENSSTSTVKVKGSFAEMFKADSDFSFGLSCTTSTTLNKNISSTITLSKSPGSTKNLVNTITVTPYWLVAKDRSQAYWIPADYQYNSPWCLTWSIASLDPVPRDDSES